jgi:hypothetical protein
MTEKNDEVPEDAKRDSQGVPYGTGDETGQKTYVREGDTPVDTDQSDRPEPKGYYESLDHVPDPTAMTGTLETSGTGGGAHETLRGTTGVFDDLSPVVEQNGLPLYGADAVQALSGDSTGQPSPHGGADAQVSQKSAGPESASYNENVIAGGGDPNLRQSGEPAGAFTTAVTVQEDPEGTGAQEEGDDGSKEQSEPETKAPAKKTAAKKTTAAARKTSTVEPTDDTKNA